MFKQLMIVDRITANKLAVYIFAKAYGNIIWQISKSFPQEKTIP